MKKYLCVLLAALLLISCAALAETEATEQPSLEQLRDELLGFTPAPTELPEATEAPEEVYAPELEGLPTSATVRVGFEDGFALELPQDWLYHAVTEEMAEQGVVYCLSDAAGTGWLYVQNWDTDCATMEELKELIDRTTQLQTSGIYSFNGTEFVIYDLTDSDVSCCAALMDGRVLNLVFTPQSDTDFMAVAAQILNTFEVL